MRNLKITIIVLGMLLLATIATGVVRATCGFNLTTDIVKWNWQQARLAVQELPTDEQKLSLRSGSSNPKHYWSFIYKDEAGSLCNDLKTALVSARVHQLSGTRLRELNKRILALTRECHEQKSAIAQRARDIENVLLSTIRMRARISKLSGRHLDGWCRNTKIDLPEYYNEELRNSYLRSYESIMGTMRGYFKYKVTETQFTKAFCDSLMDEYLARSDADDIEGHYRYSYYGSGDMGPGYEERMEYAKCSLQAAKDALHILKNGDHLLATKQKAKRWLDQ